MASDSTHTGIEDAKKAATGAIKKAAHVVDAHREKAADVIEDAADTIGEQGKKGPRAVRNSADTAKDRLDQAADYVRDHSAEEMGRDAMSYARAYPIGSLLAFGAIVIGGSMLLAAMVDDDQVASDSDQHTPRGLSSAVGGFAKSSETLDRLRDAAFGFALAKAVEAADELWPGFKEHYDKH